LGLLRTRPKVNVPPFRVSEMAFSYQKMPVSYQKQRFSYHLPLALQSLMPQFP